MHHNIWHIKIPYDAEHLLVSFTPGNIVNNPCSAAGYCLISNFCPESVNREYYIRKFIVYQAYSIKSAFLLLFRRHISSARTGGITTDVKNVGTIINHSLCNPDYLLFVSDPASFVK